MRFHFLPAAVLLALTGLSAGADTGPGSTAGLLSGIKAGSPMRMVYELDANAMFFIIPATGRASFDIELNPDVYAIRSRVRTTGLADIFVNYDMELAASGHVRSGDLKTSGYVSQNRDGKKNRRVELTMSETGFSMTAKPAFGNLGDPAATQQQAILANDPLTALITFALEPRTPGEDPCGGPIRVFDGKQLTYLHLSHAGSAEVRTPAWRGRSFTGR